MYLHERYLGYIGRSHFENLAFSFNQNCFLRESSSGLPNSLILIGLNNYLSYITVSESSYMVAYFFLFYWDH